MKVDQGNGPNRLAMPAMRSASDATWPSLMRQLRQVAEAGERLRVDTQ
jgi:hypothetical protein